jgi:predicted MFS family arabinose efflux permease
MTQLLVVAFFAGVASVLFVTAYRAYVPSVVAGADLVEANATLQGSEQVAQIAGRGMGGLLAQLFSPATAILADIATYVVSLMCLNGIRAREPVTRAHETPASLWSQIGDGLRFTVQDPYLRALSIFSAVGNLAYTGFLTLQIVFLVRDVGAEPSVIGVLVGTLSIGGLFGAMAAPRTSNRFGSARAMVLWAAMTAPFALLIPLTSNGPGLLLMVTGAVITGAGLVAITVIMISFRQTYCPPRLLGRVSASMQVANFAVVPLGTLASGALGSWLGSRTALWIDAALFLVYGCMLLAGPIRGLRDLPSAPVNEKASSFFR